MRIVITVALVCVMWPAAARSQTPEEQIQQLLARAEAAGIPVDLLHDKIAEGRAKGASMERIATALANRAAALSRAQQAIGNRPDVGPPELAVAADAIEAGVSEVVLTALADLAPRERRAVAIAALEHLVQNGQTPERALDRVREALQRGPDALLRLSDRRPENRPPDVQRPDGVPPSTRPDGVPAPGTPPQGGRPENVPAPAPPARP